MGTKKLNANKVIIKDSAIDIDVLETIAEGNDEVLKKLAKIKKLLLETNPSTDKKVVKLDKKINKLIIKLKKKGQKYIVKGKTAKFLCQLKKIEVLIVERGCRNRKSTPNDEKDFVIKDGVLIEYLGKDPEIVLPNSVKVIGEKAFYNSDTLVSIEGNEGLTTIKAKAFEGCIALNSVYLQKGVSMIEDDAFYNCFVLTDVIFEEGLTTIGNYAFAKCPNLYAIKIPKSVNKIGDKAFVFDKSLKNKTKRKIKKINKKALK